MASGKAHDLSGLVGGTALTLCLAHYGHTPETIASTMIGYGSGILWLSPDIDMENTRPFKRWGLFQFLVKPYAALFKHRGVSHYPIVGSLTRSFYLLPLFYFYPDPRFIIAVLIGLELSALTHLLMDYTPILRRL